MRKMRRLIFLLGLILLPAVSSAQMNTERLTAIGRNALYFEDYVLSIQYFNQVIKLKPYLPEPYQLRAIAKLQLSDYAGALEDCNRAIELNPFQPQFYYTRGYAYRALERWEEAEQDFSKALRLSPEHKTYLLLRADVYAHLHRLDEALADIDYLISRESKNASLYFEKGVISLERKDTLTAIESFKNATFYDSQNPSNFSALGMTYLISANEDEAFIQISKAINLGSHWAGDYINRGIIYYHKHNYRGALNDYDHAVTMAPQDPQTYYNRAMLRSEVGDYNRALEDFNKAIELQPSLIEMRYQRALVLLQLGQWTDALEDLEALINRFPYFLPSYYLAAQAHTALGHSKTAFRYRWDASQIESKKDSIMAARQDSLNTPLTDVMIAKEQPTKRDYRKEFSTAVAQNDTQQEKTEEQNSRYASETRGAVQHNHVRLINEPNIALSYYTSTNSVRRTNYYHTSVDEYNRRHLLPAPLFFSAQEVTLTPEIINEHFQRIADLTQGIDGTTPLRTVGQAHKKDLYLARALEFAEVQDYSSAIEDATQSIRIDAAKPFVYFCRANWRVQSGKDYRLAIFDYDMTIDMAPDFSFAYYNKANLLCAMQVYSTAIEAYSQAIEIDPDFAEAYFNRGLTYIYTDQVELGIADLSKAGELGIYQAYNILTRFR